MAGCIANVSFARLNEATVRVLQKNGCDVIVAAGQTCCGALAVHAGLREQARTQARRNVDALLNGGYDAIITNDLEGRLLFANRRFREWFGLGDRDIRGQPLEDCVAPEWRATFVSASCAMRSKCLVSD